MRFAFLMMAILLASCSSINGKKEINYKVYVINLDRAPKRMEHMSKTLDSFHINFERINAVDGYNIKIKELDSGVEFSSLEVKNKKIALKPNKRYMIDCGRESEVNYIHNTSYKPLTLGELGCTCSHRKVYYEFLKTKADVAVVFEDDLKIKTKEFPFLLHSAINNIPSNSIVFMDAWGPSIDSIKRNNPNGDLFIKLGVSRKIFGLYAVVIDRKFAHNMLMNSAEEYYPIDITISHKISDKEAKGFLLNKRSVSFHGDFGSDINKMGRSH